MRYTRRIKTIITDRSYSRNKKCTCKYTNNLVYPKLQKVEGSHFTHEHIVDRDTDISLTLMNAQSVRNKTLTINEYVREENIDLLAITQTWLKQDGDMSVITELIPEGCTVLSVCPERDEAAVHCSPS